MQIWADVYSPQATLLGPGPIVHISGARINRGLDGADSFSFDVPGTDARGLDLLQTKRRIQLKTLDGGNEINLGRFIIENIGARDTSSGWTRSCSGPGQLGELKFKTTRRGRKYDAQTVSAVIDSLLGLTSGWTRSGSSSNLVNVRYDGATLLKAVQSLVTQQGIHFRQGASGILEVGAFGESNGLRAINTAVASVGLGVNDDVMLIESFSLDEDSEAIVNWLEPLGAGRGDAALTLEKSTRTTPYTIQSETGPDGRTVYFIEDASSQAANGLIEKTGTFKDIAPLSNSEADQIAAANALYDMAASWLQRYSQKYVAYTMSVKKVPKLIKPGEKIHVSYHGWITDEAGERVDFRTIEDDFWVMEVSTTFSTSGITTHLKVATIDRYEQDVTGIILGALEEIRIQNVSVEPYFSKSIYVYRRELDDTHEAVIPIDLTNATQALTRCRLRLVTRPFRATAKSAKSTTSASGGGSTQT
ncbi:MAG: hypothetical protein K8L99_20745, partial [Anaerolineae bacterium]|nr:hypothetical protein [Anaerolineae bacterium]